MRFWGMVNAAAYSLTKHHIARLSLLWWLSVLVVAWVILLAVGAVQLTAWRVALAAVGALLSGVLWVARQRGYVAFRSHGAPDPEETRMLEYEEKIPARATGSLVVGDLEGYFAGLEAWYETVATREHIVIARNPESRLLLFAKSLGAESGMWYAFFRPEHIVAIEVGELFFGLKKQPAVRIAYRVDDSEEQDAIYLAFRDRDKRDLVLNDLLLDAELS